MPAAPYRTHRACMGETLSGIRDQGSGIGVSLLMIPAWRNDGHAHRLTRPLTTEHTGHTGHTGHTENIFLNASTASQQWHFEELALCAPCPPWLTFVSASAYTSLCAFA